MIETPCVISLDVITDPRSGSYLNPGSRNRVAPVRVRFKFFVLG